MSVNLVSQTIGVLRYLLCCPGIDNNNQKWYNYTYDFE